jgi:hypothetical protein
MVMVQRIKNILFILLISIIQPSGAQQVRLTAKTDSTVFPLGGWIDVHLEGNVDQAVESIAPIVKDSIGPFEVVSIERAANEPQWLIRLTSIDSGKIFLPPIEFGYKIKGDTNTHKAYSNSLLLTITGVTIDPQGEIKDIKPPMDAPWLFEDFLPYLIGLIILIVLAGGSYYYRRRKKMKQDMLEDVQVIIPPHREALTALRILEEKKLWQEGRVKEYYSEVTEIIRRFFERRWNIIALEMTTDEIFLQLKLVPEALMVWKQMGSFFLTADLVKFAKYQPSPAEHEQEMHTAYEIVRAMTPQQPLETEPQLQQQESTADVR